MSNVNNYPGSFVYTLAELAQFINQSPDNYISYWCNRNPTAVYNYLIRNYPMFGRYSNNMQATPDGITQMYDFLVKQFNILPAEQRAHWLAVLGHSMPDAGELINWTTPKH